MIEKIIIFPDIHGRTFWKRPFDEYKDDETVKFVFLGDYLDPYDFECINHKKAWDNLQDILNKFDTLPQDRVEWLIGNHDMHYLKHFQRGWGVRRDTKYYECMDSLISQDRFKIAYECVAGRKRYLFTHAGVTKGWADAVVRFKYPENDWEDVYNTDFLNRMKSDGLNMLWYVSYMRGGNCPSGSCVWADVHEHLDMHLWWKEDVYDKLNIYQVFGHTLSFIDFDEYYICDDFAMLDARQPFILDIASGEIKPLYPKENDDREEISNNQIYR